MRKPIVFTSEREMPPMAVSLADMGHNRTGSWRYMRPIYSEKIAPCKNACPLGNDIPRILSLVSEGRYEEPGDSSVKLPRCPESAGESAITHANQMQPQRFRRSALHSFY
jgi:hypothetical protein